MSKKTPSLKKEKASPPKASAPKAATPKTAIPKAPPSSSSAALERPVYEAGTRNPYLPMPATVIDVIRETPNIMTFHVVLQDEQAMKDFSFEPGQLGQLSVFGVGESTFVISSPPTRKECLQFSVMRAGEVTTALHKLTPGDTVGVRAPLGNSFPYEKMKGKDIVFIGGGIGMAPLRTLFLFMLDNRKDYGKITLLYGARTPEDMAYSSALPEWLGRKDIDCVLTVDNPVEGWEHKVGLIPNILLEMNPEPKNSIAIVCGPPIMIKFTLQALEKLKFAPDQIYTTLEKRMKCGVGICGRCNIGSKYVCIDGPVFSLNELKEIPNEL